MWCKYNVTPNYKHSSLPRGQPLKDEALHAALADFLAVHARNSHRLSPNGSTKANESFNNIVACKCPKNRQYSSSESFNFRLAAAAAQKNRGKKYLTDTLEKVPFSPSVAHNKRATVAACQMTARKQTASHSRVEENIYKKRVERGGTRKRRGNIQETC